jgi:hypothetical protein
VPEVTLVVELRLELGSKKGHGVRLSSAKGTLPIQRDMRTSSS